ncbi:DNA terminal protector protein [Serratia phage SP1]|nr:DNA terminal protector protein [Serratia phage SP1]
MIFESTAPKNRKERDWVALGVEFSKAKKKGVSSRQFADDKGILYSTFSKAMSRYSAAIKMALRVESIHQKPVHKLNREEKALKLINSFRSSLRDRVKDQGAATNNKSMRWFADTIKKSVRSHSVTRPSMGKIYAFAYDAKHKDTLPYWDKYPLIIYLGDATAKNGSYLWYGLNLHYIPPKARQSFLEELLKSYANTPVISNKTKLKINWSKVKGMRGSDLMIKAYLPNRLRGPMLEIKPDDWANIVLMPTQSFQSKGKRYGAQQVWKKY